MLDINSSKVTMCNMYPHQQKEEKDNKELQQEYRWAHFLVFLYLKVQKRASTLTHMKENVDV